MKLTTALQKVGIGIIVASTFLIPLLFLPVTSEFYDYNKQMFLILAASALVLLWVGTFIGDKQVRITRNPYSLPLLGFAASWLASAFLRSPNYADAFFDPNQAGTFVALVFFFIAAVNLVRSKKEVETIFHTMVASVSVVAFLAIIWASGLGEKIAPAAFMQNPVWTPVGNPFSTLVVLGSFVPFLITFLVREKANSAKSLILSISLFLCVVGSGLLAYRMFRPGSQYRPLFLTQQVSWSIALESMKNSPLLGTGPATYYNSFTQFRPLNFNLRPEWAVRFSSATNWYLQVLSVLGIFGLATYALIVLRTVRFLAQTVRAGSESSLNTIALASAAASTIIFGLQFLLPPSLTLFFITFVMLVMLVVSAKLLGFSSVHDANIDIVAHSDSGHRTAILPWIALILAVAAIAPSVFFAGRAYAAETLFQKALTAAAANQGKETYDTLISTIRVNPYKDTYHVAYSQTNLLLANSIASKQNLTDEERNTVAQLIQQAIREAKNAVALNPTKVSNLENMAAVYRNLLDFAQGADVWTVASYREAIKLDPINPNLRIALGGVYYATKNYDEAIRLFTQAVDLKPNLANAHYNLAAAYIAKGDNQAALNSLQNVLNLVDRNSPDYQQAQAEFEELKKKVGQNASPSNASTAPAKTELEAPKAQPSPKVNPPFTLPSELGPSSASPSGTNPPANP